ncbi:hypothetical protein F5Y10DRAFT_293250 [Nemania abortiva]|nr:hypothetical protein F5Y10DRAFT_293250 [Nemania abortiva]
MSNSAVSSLLRRPDRPGSPPSSPWAERFPWEDTTVVLGGTRHSYLAPQYPKIEDPKYYDQQPNRNRNHIPRGDKEIDYVLRGESVQGWHFSGLRTWKLAALNRHIVLSTKGDYMTVPKAQRRSLGEKVIQDLKDLKISFSRLNIDKTPLGRGSKRLRQKLGLRLRPQTPDTPAPPPQAPGTPAPPPQAPGTRSPLPQTPGVPAPFPQTPGAPAPFPQTPGVPAPLPQTPGAPAPLSRAPGAPALRSETPETPTRLSRALGGPAPRAQRLPTPLYEGPQFQTFEKERIQVDETKWYPFLRKDRWFDWVQFFPGIEPSNPDKIWSVDDAQIWGAISVSLELADRMLKALVKDQHIGGPKLEEKVFDFRNRVTRATKAKRNATQKRDAAETELRLTGLLSRSVWGFGILGSIHGYTDPWVKTGSGGRAYSSLINLNIGKLEAILNPDLTLSERCMAQVDLTITILHELMHAIWQSRVVEVGYQGNLWKNPGQPQGPVWPNEPYLDAEGFNECGFYMENLFFGGVADLIPLSTVAKFGRPVPTLMFSFNGWPEALRGKSYTPADKNAGYLKDGAVVRSYPTSSSWPTKMLAEAFWEDQKYPNKSDNFFHRSTLFISTTRLSVSGDVVTYENWRRGIRVRKAKRPPEPPFDYPEDGVVVKDWNEQIDVWARIRAPWYEYEFAEWSLSPWGERVMRELVDEFEHHFAQKDHFACAGISDSFLTWVDWKGGHREYLADMPDRNRASSDWAWHCIGLLMSASIPLRERKLARIGETGRKWTLQHAPSQEASAAGHHNTIYSRPLGGLGGDAKEETIPASEYWNTAYPNGSGRIEIENFTQMDYLQSIVETQSLITGRQGLVYADIHTAIVQAHKDLLADRTNLEICYPGRGHTTRWASNWYFKMPEYSQRIIGWDPRTRRWENRDPTL